MKDILKKTFLLGLGAASMTRNQVEKVVNNLIKKNAITIKEGKEMLKQIKSHAAKEGKKIKKKVDNEAKKAAKKLNKTTRTQMKVVRKNINSLNKDLTARGKKTLKKVLKQISQ